ncbi:Fusaric acid resistance protein-like-domain-containing protein [Mycotypha africana]|uniref:Fusaric acid resistance protein-like-domain-containing protein n=1 Tax=Mycotypha africana TaxID=64632 RepID=UPI002301F5D0|nr:Fusaric acid resistance protein-like-domain-containing protein [Mycotypha africana]KAI8982478.1 Fusaric acid resistance protein-like-domain-containing protein [Mycotypha africana]
MMLNVGMMIPCAVWSGLVTFFCTLYNRALLSNPHLYHNGAGFIGAIGFAICVFTTAYVRLKYPRLLVPTLQGFTMPFFIITLGAYKTDYDVLETIRTVYGCIIGGVIALIVNLTIFPETAAKAAEKSIGSTIESIKDVLAFVHEDLLKNDDSGVMTGDIAASTKLQNLNDKLQKNINNMRTASQNAKYEIIVAYFSPKDYVPLANSLNSLSHNLYGFSLAIKREVRIMIEKKNDQVRLSILSDDTLLQPRDFRNIDRLQAAIQPSLKTFLSSCITALNQIEAKLVEYKAITLPKSVKDKQPTSFNESDLDLEFDLEQFKEAEMILQEDYDRADALPSEDRFLVFTVIFTLVQFGKDLIQLQKVTDDMILKSNRGKAWPFRIYLPHVHLQSWLSRGSENKGQSAPEKVILDNQRLQQSRGSFSNSLHKNTRPFFEEEGEEKNTTTAATDEEDDIGCSEISRRVSLIADRIQGNSVPLQQIEAKQRWKRWLYNFNKWLQYGPTRYGIKFMITCSLLSLMAFLPIDGVNKLYNENHGQWALLSAMVVFNYTAGSTVLQCFYRIIATIIGALAGYICLLAGHRDENPYVIAVLVCIFQIPMWYFLFATRYPRIGFISILTLAVITSTGYLNSFGEDEFAPAWKRTVTAFMAIIVVMLVDQLVWPVRASERLRIALADLLIDTGIHYSRVASLVCQEDTNSHRYLSTFRDCEATQRSLLNHLRVVREMLSLVESEPRFTKGPFPGKEYAEILDHERNILFWIYHIQKAQSLISPSVRKIIMHPVNSYRKELAAAVHLYLFTLACSIRTKSSLPASLPSAEMARHILQTKRASQWKQNYEELCKISAASVAQRKSAEHQVFWHTYAAGCTEVVIEQEAMGELVARLMGQHVFTAATNDWLRDTTI